MTAQSPSMDYKQSGDLPRPQVQSASLDKLMRPSTWDSVNLPGIALLRSYYAPMPATWADCVSFLNAECSALSLVGEDFADKLGLHLLVAGNHFLVELVFGSPPLITLQLPSTTFGCEDFLLRCSASSSVLELCDALRYFASLDQLKETYCQLAFHNLSCLHTLPSDSIMSGIGLFSANQTKIGPSLVYYIMPDRRFHYDFTLYDPHVFSLFITMVPGKDNKVLALSAKSFFEKSSISAPLTFSCTLCPPLYILQETLELLQSVTLDLRIRPVTYFESHFDITGSSTPCHLLCAICVSHPSALSQIVPWLRQQALFNQFVHGMHNTPEREFRFEYPKTHVYFRSLHASATAELYPSRENHSQAMIEGLELPTRLCLKNGRLVDCL